MIELIQSFFGTDSVPLTEMHPVINASGEIVAAKELRDLAMQDEVPEQGQPVALHKRLPKAWHKVFHGHVWKQ